jgi:hypothetical protein
MLVTVDISISIIFLSMGKALCTFTSHYINIIKQIRDAQVPSLSLVDSLLKYFGHTFLPGNNLGEEHPLRSI